MELRALKTSDIFPMFNIMKKIGVNNLRDKLTPDMIKSFSEQGGEDQEDKTTYIGFNIVMEVVSSIIEGLPACESDIYSFLASLAGVKPKQIADLPPADTMQLIVDVIQKDEFADFFKVVSKLFNRET